MTHKKQIINAAVQIGDGLIAKAISHPHGIYWETRILARDSSPTTVITANIYNGASGIALFLLDLYRATEQKQYLEAAQKAMNWVIWYSRTKDWNEYSFYIGRTGAAYVLIQLYKITGDHRYLSQALAITKGSIRFLEKKPVCDLLLGVGGTILGLLHLHAATREDWILEEIRAHFDYLVAQIIFEPVGIYWDRSDKNIRGLCSLSHGASGIGFVLLEMSRYFANPAFSWLARQAFLYEDNYYDPTQRNWPDFRKLFAPSFMFAWCHGAPGIGLARLRGFEILGDQNLLTNVVYSRLTKPTVRERGHLGLCHGLSGLMEINRLHGSQHHWTKALINHFSGQLGNRTELSRAVDLFNGQAGVGYAMLKSLVREKFSVLYPVLGRLCPTNTRRRFSDDISTLKMRLVERKKNKPPDI